MSLGKPVGRHKVEYTLSSHNIDIACLLPTVMWYEVKIRDHQLKETQVYIVEMFEYFAKNLRYFIFI